MSLQHLFPFLILLLFSCLLSASSSQATLQRYHDCLPVPFTCGDLHINISYPFLIDSRPDYCGHPGFYLNCTDNDTTLTITMNATLYIVKDLDYFNSVITIMNPDFSGHLSALTYTNTTIDTTIFELYDRNQMLNLYLNCSLPSIPSSLMSIPCLLEETGKHSYFSFLSDGLQGFPGECSSTAIIPVKKEEAGRLSSNSTLFGELLQEGFMVKWITGRGWCSFRTNSGGVCAYDGNNPADQTCLCPYGSTTGVCSNGVTNRIKKKRIIIGALIGIAGILTATFICLCYFRRKRQQHTPSALLDVSCWRNTSKDQTIETFIQKHGTLSPKRYSYSEVKKITRSFQHKLGQGGFGTVFKGNLSDGHAVAVKLLNTTNGNGDGEEFLNEVASIGRTSHINIVSLVGFCFQGSKRALIYDLMPNGSLEKNCFQIAVGIARGLEYLHRGCNTKIVHFDIKPHNILLDEDFHPKIADFGLAKFGTHKESILSLAGARGTIGYIAPEVFSRSFGIVSSKSDVYSYGKMILEMAGGRKNVKVTADRTSEIYFPHWIYEHFDENEGMERYGMATDTHDIGRKLIVVGLWCIQTRPESRPTMSKAVEMLEGSINDLELPPKPYLFSPPRSPST
ncbi:putative glycerophosphodiester phosphodiesterase, protein kinase RLK-Pelle-LRK10L-2 family [Dioscorea sansibarensis]